MGVGASEDSGTHRLIWANPWFAVGCAFVLCGVALVLWMLSLAALKARRPPKRGPTIREHVEQHIPLPPGLGRGLGVLIPDVAPPSPPPEPSPLQLKLVDEEWRPVGGVWVTGLKVRMTNISDEPIELTRFYRYTSDLDEDDTFADLPEVSDSAWELLDEETEHMKARHKGEVFTPHVRVLPLKPLTRWYISLTAMPVPEQGRPWCKLRIKDSMGNAYHLAIPARPAQTYQS